MDQVSLALIDFDGLQLLIPQAGIATIEMIDGMELSDGTPGAVGNLCAGGREWPVFALDAQFNLLDEPAHANKYCVAFDVDGQAAFAIACDEVSSLMASPDEIKPMQACMRNPDSPVQAMLLKDEKLILVSQVQALQRFFAVGVAA